MTANRAAFCDQCGNTRTADLTPRTDTLSLCADLAACQRRRAGQQAGPRVGTALPVEVRAVAEGAAMGWLVAGVLFALLHLSGATGTLRDAAETLIPGALFVYAGMFALQRVARFRQGKVAVAKGPGR